VRHRPEGRFSTPLPAVPSRTSPATIERSRHRYDKVYGDRDILPRDLIAPKLSVPNGERVFFLRNALRGGFTIEEIFQLTKIDRWFLTQIKEIVDVEEELAATKT